MEKIIVVGQGQDYGQIRWHDITRVEGATYLYAPFKKMNRISSVLCHAHSSFRLNKLFNLPLKGIWKRFYSLSVDQLDDNDEYIVIFTDNALARYDPQYTRLLHQKANVTLVLMITNAMYRRGRILSRHFPYLDLVYTFSKADAEKYKLLYQPDIYSEIEYNESTVLHHDVFFAGLANDRLPMLHAIYEKLDSEAVKTQFFIQKVQRQLQIGGNIHYNQWLNYDQIIANDLDSNCILEVVGERYTGMTLRTVEALTFKKKLLTNNASIKDTDFYDPRFIQVFTTADEIDTEFLKRREKVTFHYENVYSPIAFVDRIRQDISKAGVRHG